MNPDTYFDDLNRAFSARNKAKFQAGVKKYGGLEDKPAMLAELENENCDTTNYLYELRRQLELAVDLLGPHLAERAVWEAYHVLRKILREPTHD